jgi:hypothetical protein
VRWSLSTPKWKEEPTPVAVRPERFIPRWRHRGPGRVHTQPGAENQRSPRAVVVELATGGWRRLPRFTILSAGRGSSRMARWSTRRWAAPTADRSATGATPSPSAAASIRRPDNGRHCRTCPSGSITALARRHDRRRRRRRLNRDYGKGTVYEDRKGPKGQRYISTDLDQHEGRIFKGADKIEVLGSKKTRSSTYGLGIVDGEVQGVSASLDRAAPSAVREIGVEALLSTLADALLQLGCGHLTIREPELWADVEAWPPARFFDGANWSTPRHWCWFVRCSRRGGFGAGWSRMMQRDLIGAGQWDLAMDMEYDDIKAKFPGAYDDKIAAHKERFGGGSC